MRIAIMQPYIFPYLGYFQLISAVDKFVIYDDVNFITRGWINRNNILVDNKATLFTIPLRNASQNRLINEIEIASDIPWKAKFLKTIEQSYKKSPYFKDVFSLLNQILAISTTHICQLALESVKAVANYIRIPTEFIDSSSKYENRYLKAQERILDICKCERVTQYLNPIGGIEIYSRNLFERHGINLYFLSSRIPIYKQFNREFIASLSIIDILMFNSIEETRNMLLLYDLI